MLKYFKKIFYLLFIVFIIIGIREFIVTYTLLKDISPILGYAFIVITLFFIFWFGLLPIFKILMLPKLPGPYIGNKAPKSHLTDLANVLKFNKNVLEISSKEEIENLNSNNYEELKNGINIINKKLSKIVHQHRKTVVNQVFLGTAVSQNGVLDSFIVLSRIVNNIMYIYKIYNGRPNIIGLLKVFRICLNSILISSSADTVTNTLSEVVVNSLGFAKQGSKNLPVVGSLLDSFSNGLINAVIATRISMITEAYCTKIEISNEKELNPPIHTVIEITKYITMDMKDVILSSYSGIENSVLQIFNYSKNGIQNISSVIEKTYNGIFGKNK